MAYTSSRVVEDLSAFEKFHITIGLIGIVVTGLFGMYAYSTIIFLFGAIPILSERLDIVDMGGGDVKKNKRIASVMLLLGACAFILSFYLTPFSWVTVGLAGIVFFGTIGTRILIAYACK